MSLAANRPHAVVRPVQAAEVVGAADAAAPRAYVGLVTRAIAFAADAAVIQVVAIAVAGTFALILSVISLPDEFDGVLVVAGSVAYGLWLVGYFVVFWSATGQTPGNRLLQIRVCRAVDGAAAPSAGAALLRFGGLIVAALPLFAGFVPILFDDRRRGLQDMIAGTVVVTAPPAGGIHSRPQRGSP
jgi:uncharacterized RDD family membrane protein YckC